MFVQCVGSGSVFLMRADGEGWGVIGDDINLEDAQM